MQKRKSPQQLKQQLFRLLKEYSFREGRVVLSSGKISNYYIDARVVTLTSAGAFLSASIILDLIKDKDICAVGGPTLGADPFLGAIAVLSFLKKRPLKTFIIRKTPKEHGARKRIEGPPFKKGDKIIIVDDIATSGKSLLDCISVLQKEGAVVKGAVVIVDREEGAQENLTRVNCPFTSIFKASDFKT